MHLSIFHLSLVVAGAFTAHVATADQASDSSTDSPDTDSVIEAQSLGLTCDQLNVSGSQLREFLTKIKNLVLKTNPGAKSDNISEEGNITVLCDKLKQIAERGAVVGAKATCDGFWQKMQTHMALPLDQIQSSYSKVCSILKEMGLVSYDTASQSDESVTDTNTSDSGDDSKGLGSASQGDDVGSSGDETVVEKNPNIVDKLSRIVLDNQSDDAAGGSDDDQKDTPAGQKVTPSGPSNDPRGTPLESDNHQDDTPTGSDNTAGLNMGTYNNSSQHPSGVDNLVDKIQDIVDKDLDVDQSLNGTGSAPDEAQN